MTRTLILAAVVAALVSPIALQAGNSALRPQAQTAPMRTHPTRHQRLPGMNHAPNVTLKRGAIAN
jgi:hypothetical protein